MELAQETKLFRADELASNFSIHVNTARRYTISAERVYSRELSKKKHLLYKQYLGNCADCGKRITGHSRCSQCDILIHFDPELCRCGRQHGLSTDGRTCDTCIGEPPAYTL